MRLLKIVFLVALILLISPMVVKAAEQDALLLTLDRGFVDRPVELAVFEGSFIVGWEAGVLMEPSVMEIVQLSDDQVEIVFADAAAIHSAGMLSVAFPNAGYATRINTSALNMVDGQKRLMISVPEAVEVTEAVSPRSETQPVAATENGVIRTEETVFLTLDQGFVARPVSLELFDGELVVAWDEQTLIAPTTLRITRTEGGIAVEDAVEAAKGVALRFGDSDAISNAGSMILSHKAHRPQAPSEHAETIVQATGEVVPAMFEGDRFTYEIPASAELVYTPSYRNGIMQTGIASWYAYKDCLCAASPDVPKGTRMKVSRQDDPSRFTVVTINDWGPDRSVHPERVIDLDQVAFSRIGNPRGGVLAVDVEVLDPEDPLYAMGDELPPPPWRW
ncbi:hypothetical protein GF380_02825 [Candidatus Uhrbacteria bacterium]|nr:hypothetical protein [Candidatus Uhrbacteria bacterium]MBD3284085.1 hypothetical protein [Candidatus Uhrbacteria bacterium]